MKKTLLISVLTLLVLSVNLFAETGKFDFWGGYTTVKMGRLNNLIKNAGESIGEKYTEIKNGFIIGADYLFLNINENINLDGRLAYLGTNEGKLDGYDFFGNPITTKINTSLIPIMIGGTYRYGLNDKFSLNGKLYVGYGLINFKTEDSIKDIKKTTSCFVTDISIGAEYAFTERFGLGFDVGYRFTPKTTIENDLKVDFSGMTTALSLNYKV